ncbi:ABC transporter permease subunit [Pseudorhizobium pelagicum]|uniref:Polar amino acid ABC transporter permease n=1 Tax=Pseudorhizobium pelagicum TaxID=1509405 RepID=A0A922P1D6_9HYPH|nr:ABC transporter permease subunit [Pseudorhizobium pelagicum]KEQ03714.1 polar amino acid ABC transporter permease [Pseudorhizobium pelagicum]KEQ08230.1 polar amino acid ABC transporter permease [Pseudorhizobium pelagicum]
MASDIDKRGQGYPRRSDMAVLLPLRPAPQMDSLSLTTWLAKIRWWQVMLLMLVWPLHAFAQGAVTVDSAVAVLYKWAPFLLLHGFLFNVLISILSMALGTGLGVLLGLTLISKWSPLRFLGNTGTAFFRNAPWLVLLFVVLLAFPFELTIFGTRVPLPGWIKAVIGLSLPVAANIAIIVRGAIQSVPSAQWEAAESLSFSRMQTLWQIIIPQCIKRMIPPWMNWYAILTMATPLCSILGTEEMVTLTRQAMEAEGNKPELLMPFYGFILVLFFLYCYPIAKLTVRLERKFAFKL